MAPPTSPSDPIDPPARPAYELYAAAAFGAFCLGLGDLLNNEKAATVLKIGEVLRLHIYSGLGSGGLVAFGLLVFLGAGLCWIHQPQGRVDAFTRGFSVFAILAVVTPYTSPTAAKEVNVDGGGVLEVSSLFVSTAYAQEAESRERGSVKLKIETAGSAGSESTVTVRDATSGRTVGVAKTRGGELELAGREGRYLIEVESEGHRRSSAEIQLGGQEKVYELELEKSRVPLSLQRLIGTQAVEVRARQ